jgi:RimJ/RimL family protein N-acetyltransferase
MGLAVWMRFTPVAVAVLLKLRGVAVQNSEERTKDCPVLETERLLLRRPDAGDIGAIAAIAGDWEVARRLARVPHPYGDEDARFFLDMIVPSEWVWAVTLRKAGGLVGMVGLTPEAGHHTAELGYYLDRRHWGIGIATEAARSVVDYGVRVLGLRCLTAGYFLDNPSSGRVLSKLGFVEVGRGERPCKAAGTTVPSVEMRLEVSRA